MPVLNRTKPQILDIPRHRILTTLPKQEGVPEPETPETQIEDKTVGAPEPETTDTQTPETQKEDTTERAQVPETSETPDTQKVRMKIKISLSTRENSTPINAQKVCKTSHPK